MATRSIQIILLIAVLVLGASLAYFAIVPGLPLGRSSSTSASTESTQQNRKNASFALSAAISLPNLSGRIDHMEVDIARGRVFVTFLGNNSLVVVDINSGKIARLIGGLHSPQNVAFVAERDRLYVSNADDGSVDIFDASSFTLQKVLPFSNDADNMRYDSSAKLLYVGYGEGGIGVVNVTSEEIAAKIPLLAHPESFQLEQKGPRIFVNVPAAGSIVVIDRTTRSVTATWNIPNFHDNFPMALDESHNRLFIGTRTPPKLVSFDTTSGKLVGSVDIGYDPDDVYFDSSTGLVYVSCGQGTLEIVRADSTGQLVKISSTVTRANSRTSLFVPYLQTLYVGVPSMGTLPAELRGYKLVTSAGSPIAPWQAAAISGWGVVTAAFLSDDSIFVSPQVLPRSSQRRR